MVGNKNSGRPGGNPNIKNVRKTGPRTREGKLKLVEKNLKNGKYSKLIHIYRARGCNFCPLRPKEYEVQFGEKAVKRKEKPLCVYYKKDSKLCMAPLDDTIARIKNFTLLHKVNKLEAYDELARDGVVDLELRRMLEISTQGAPGKQTTEMRSMLLQAIREKEKMLLPQKIESKNLNVNIDMTEAIIAAYREEDEKEWVGFGGF